MIKVVCPGCGLELDSEDQALDDRYNASSACRRLFDELSAFTQNSGDKDFIHQIAIDAYTAQHLGPKIKPIGGTFALIGLYLAFERGYTGRQVQLAHMALGKTRRDWPRFVMPVTRAGMTIHEVVNGLNGENFRERINSWAKAVWETWGDEHQRVTVLVDTYLR